MVNFMRAESNKIRHSLTLLCLAAVLKCGAVQAQEGGDLQEQILYAYQTQNLSQLREIRQTLADGLQASTATAAIRYHLAHADYRIAQLGGPLARGKASDSLEECVSQLDELLDQDKSSAEALALQSLCYVELAKLKKLQAVLLRSRAADRLARAEESAPRNPRVKLVRALEKLQLMQPSQAIPRELEECVNVFERSSATGNDAPGWGHAEAYLLMGHELRLRGDIDGARNWIEKALIAAPDFKSAQLELTQLSR